MVDTADLPVKLVDLLNIFFMVVPPYAVAVLFRFRMRQVAESTSAASSATITALHTPSVPRTSGSSKTADTSKISVRAKEMRAEVKPSFRAVKKEEA